MIRRKVIKHPSKRLFRPARSNAQISQAPTYQNETQPLLLLQHTLGNQQITKLIQARKLEANGSMLYLPKAISKIAKTSSRSAITNQAKDHSTKLPNQITKSQPENIKNRGDQSSDSTVTHP